MINQLRTAERLRRLAATQAIPWTPVGSEILDENHNRVVLADSASRAAYIADLHNNILSLCVLLFVQCKKHLDRVSMAKEQQQDG